MVKKIANQVTVLIEETIAYIPGLVGMLIRYMYLNVRSIHLGYPVYIGQGVVFHGENNMIGNNVDTTSRSYFNSSGGYLEIGNNVSFNSNVYIEAGFGGVIIIGDGVMVGANVVIQASEHNYDSLDISMKAQGHRSGRIVIGNGAWIGSNAVITSDVVIGTGVIVGAGAVVTHSIKEYKIVGGVPAKVIGDRREEDMYECVKS